MSRLYFDSPPAYQTVDPRVELSRAIASEESTQAIQIEREDTPRNRFKHHVELRQELQFDEWQHMLIEHLVTTQAPTTFPCLSNSDMGRDRELESAEWPIHNLVQTVLTDKSRHWQKAGFASATMGAPSVKFHRDFASLRANLPEPARERLDLYNV